MFKFEFAAEFGHFAVTVGITNSLPIEANPVNYNMQVGMLRILVIDDYVLVIFKTELFSRILSDLPELLLCKKIFRVEALCIMHHWT